MSGNNLITNSEVKITLSYNNSKAAESIRDAISPENQETPLGILIETDLQEATLFINIKSSRGMGTLIATIDDLLSCIQAAERAIKEIE